MTTQISRLPQAMPALGCEWVVDAAGCEPDALRDVARLRALVERAIDELGLRPVAAPVWHVFPGEGGVTGAVVLAESHLALHTFPEHGAMTVNLYCCRERAPWPWRERLGEAVGADAVEVRSLRRGGR